MTDNVGPVSLGRLLTGRENVTPKRTGFGTIEWSCDAGQPVEPYGCERHSEHHWCDTCRGFYGVPHDGIHDGPNAHPRGPSDAEQCACRPCKDYTAGRTVSDEYVLVCDACLSPACAAGNLLCEDAQTAGLSTMRRATWRAKMIARGAMVDDDD